MILFLVVFEGFTANVFFFRLKLSRALSLTLHKKLGFLLRIFFCKSNQIRRKLQICSFLPKKILRGKLHILCYCIRESFEEGYLTWYPVNTTRRAPYKKVFLLKISQNSQENVCIKDSLTLLKKRPWHRCFPVNFAKILRNLFYIIAPPVDASEGILQTNFWKFQSYFRKGPWRS